MRLMLFERMSCCPPNLRVLPGSTTNESVDPGTAEETAARSCTTDRNKVATESSGGGNGGGGLAGGKGGERPQRAGPDQHGPQPPAQPSHTLYPHVAESYADFR